MTTTIASVDVGGTGVTTSTGSGSNVLNSNPTITNPTLGGATSGGVTLAVPAVAGTNTATLPAATGTVMVSGNMPAFGYYQNATQSLSNSTFVKVLFQVKDFDTNNCVSSSRFTPTIAGYYQINATVEVVTTTYPCLVAIYKNGAAFTWSCGTSQLSTINAVANTSCVVQANGSTDYFEIYVLQATGGTTTTSGDTITHFSGSMVRSA